MTSRTDSPASGKTPPAADLIAAMQETERLLKDPSVKGYDDVEEALRALKQDP